LTVDPAVSLAVVKKELEECREDSSAYGWEIAEPKEAEQIVIVRMQSPLDKEQYVIELKFDNYKEYPLLIEFLEPRTGERGVKKAYPSNTDGFFHAFPCICHPCSRKAYSQYVAGAPHPDWTLAGWQANPGLGSLKNIRAILRAISSRISNPEFYRGRMEKLT
jgi:hypothetical protein